MSVKSFTNPQSEEILTNRILEDIYFKLIQAGIKQQEEREMGDINLSAKEFYEFMKLMSFIPEDMPSLLEQHLVHSQFVME